MTVVSIGWRQCGAIALLAVLACTGAGAKEADKEPESSRAELEQKLEAAQKRLDAAAREVADLSMSLSDHVVPHIGVMAAMRPQRAMLGINLGPRGDKGPDDGVAIASVSPGGAAAEAGLKADDVILELNGKSLKRDGEESPREKLLAEMLDVEPGDKVSVRYRRGGKVSSVSVVAEAPAHRLFTRSMPFAAHTGSHLPHFAFMRADGVFGSAELAPMTPKLGQYFGTDTGLLVIRAPEDARLKLEEGDVIMDIDGRTPKSASHALRILGSYQPGEKLKLNVLRARKRMTFDVTVPEDPWGTSSTGLGQRGFIEGHFRQGATPGDLLGPSVPPLPPRPRAVEVEEPI